MRRTRLSLAAVLCLALQAPAIAAPDPAPPANDEAQREALNRQQAEKAQQQVDENTARVMTNADEARKHAEAVKAYEAAKAQHAAQVKAYEEAMVKWRADVAACQAGDRSRCAKPAS